ncbi:hypothetical protein ACFQS1_39965 [Paractinoplanes rhizophilus]|uniref:Transposase n=1 Tax=Paractinoplanes rhizophilus TaxID=1416877 RepID=A0ABW2I5K1_9ACTN
MRKRSPVSRPVSVATTKAPTADWASYPPTSTRRVAPTNPATGWICRHPDNLVDRDTEQLREILRRCPELDAAAGLVHSFADMLTHLHGERQTAWITAAELAELPGITKFATGLTADLAAVTAGLSLPDSSGPVDRIIPPGRQEGYVPTSLSRPRLQRRPDWRQIMRLPSLAP